MAWIEAHPYAALIPVALVIVAIIVPVILAMRRVSRERQRIAERPPTHPDP